MLDVCLNSVSDYACIGQYATRETSRTVPLRRIYASASQPCERNPAPQHRPRCLSDAQKNTPRLGFSAHHRKSESWAPMIVWRRERDSNPRYAFDVYTLSRRAPSTTRPPLRIRFRLAARGFGVKAIFPHKAAASWLPFCKRKALYPSQRQRQDLLPSRASTPPCNFQAAARPRRRAIMPIITPQIPAIVNQNTA
jgi:hypothetical protein